MKWFSRIALSLAIAAVCFLGIVQAIPAQAMSQVVIGGYGDAMSNAGNEYNSLQGGYTWTTTLAARYQVVPTGGAFSRLSVELRDVPGTNPYAITLYVNGNPTACSVTIAADGTTGIDTDSVDVVAGDLVCLSSTRPSGNPDNTPTARWSIVFTGTTSGESIVLGNGLSASAGNRYAPAAGTFATAAGTNEYSEIVPTAGTLKSLYVNLDADPGSNPDAYTTKLRVNGADSDDGSGNPLAVTIVADNTTGNDTTHTISVSAGNAINMIFVPAETPSASPTVRWGMVFVSSTDGESMILGMSTDLPTNSQTEYNYLQATRENITWSTTENFQGGQAPTNDMVLKKFYVKQSGTSGAGGTGDAWDYTVRGGGGSTTITCQVLEGATTASDTTHTYTCAAYDDLAVMAVPTSAPSARIVSWGLVCYIIGASFDISNSPSSEAMGVLATSSTYYAYGSAPSNPVQDGECTFTLTNNGSGTIDIDVHGHAATGGVGATLTDGAAGENTVRITVYYTGQNPAAGVVVTTSDQEFYDALAASAHTHWDFKFEMGTSTDGVQKSMTLTFTAVAED